MSESVSQTRRLAIMQPYLFPYLGYFHLVQASDLFVFYDDVNFIKGGWINRNRILSQGKDLLFSVPLCGASQNKLISEVEVLPDFKWRTKFFRQLQQSYGRAPHFEAAMHLVHEVFNEDYGCIRDLAANSITAVMDYLGFDFEHCFSSDISPNTREIGRAERLVAITKALGCEAYVNLPSGQALYSKEYFASQGVRLSFVESELSPYKQGGRPFVPGLSIIDVLMFNSKPEVGALLQDYRLV